MKRARAAAAGLVLGAALLAPWFAPHPVDAVVTVPYGEPAAGALLGGDRLGRDVLSRLAAGGSHLVLLAAGIAVLTTAVAAWAGIAAALCPRVGWLVERAADTAILMPSVLGILLLGLAWPNGTTLGLVVVSLVFGAPYSMKVFAASAEPVAASGYIEVAISNGERLGHLVLREAAPNLRAVLAAQLALRFVEAVYLVGTAEFLQPTATTDEANWAQMVREGIGGLELNPWAALGPSLAITAVALCAAGHSRAKEATAP